MRLEDMITDNKIIKRSLWRCILSDLPWEDCQIIKIASLYLRCTPQLKRIGRSRVRSLMEKKLKRKSSDLPDSYAFSAPDGRLFPVNFFCGALDASILVGGPVPSGADLCNRATGKFEYNYEPEITRLCTKLTGEGDTVFDIGANIGWYTTLFSRLVGPSGTVHAFEPVPSTFCKLEQVVDINGANKNTILNNTALLDNVSDSITMTIPDHGRGHGGATAGTRWQTELRPDLRPPITVQVATDTLDDYCCRKGISNISFIKCDVEGAELPVLQGGEKLLSSKHPPIWQLEIFTEAMKSFNYLPSNLFAFMAAKGYRFWLISKIGDSAGVLAPGEELFASHFSWLDQHNVCVNVLVGKFPKEFDLSTHINRDQPHISIDSCCQKTS